MNVMAHQLPKNIQRESDLALYEEYIRENESSILPQNEHQTVKTNENMSYIPNENSYVPQVLNNTAFLPAFLSKHVGKLIRVEFLLRDGLEMRYGILLTVGANYLVLRQYQSNTILTCDIGAVKFVTIVPDNDHNKLF